MSDFLIEYFQSVRDRRENQLPKSVKRLQAIGKALLPLLPNTTEAIKIEYSGCGDDGEIDDITILPLRTINKGPEKVWDRSWDGPNGVKQGESYQPTIQVNHCAFPEYLSVTFEDEHESSEFSSDETEQVIKDLAFEILYNRHPGWEISDGVANGSSGSLVIEFPSLKVSLSHSANYIASDDYEDEWAFSS